MTFFSYFNDMASIGQEYFSTSLKTLIYKQRPDVFDKLDFYDQKAWLEPFAFSFFNTSNPLVEFEQLFYGYYKEEFALGQVSVLSDNNGFIFLPQIGRINIGKTRHKTSIRRINDNVLEVSGISDLEKVSSDEIQLLANSTLETFTIKHPFFDQYFYEWDSGSNSLSKQTANFDIFPNSDPSWLKLDGAFNLLKESTPDYFELVEMSNKRVALFDNLKIRNFAVRNMHGMSFIAANSNFSEMYYLEEVIHQCGHNLFNAVTAKLTEFFKINPETPLKVYSKNPNEYRSIYSTLHGLFTIAARIECFQKTLALKLDDQFRHELLGRLADLKRRFRTGLEYVDTTKVYTKKGNELYYYLENYCSEAFKRIAPLVACFDYSNQTSQDFNYQEFAQNNPIDKIPKYPN